MTDSCDVSRLSIVELISAYRAGSLSPVEVASVYLDRIEQFDAELHAYVAVTRELAMRQAAFAERAYQSGATGTLLGVPISIKDVFDVEGVVTTLGSLIHKDQVARKDSGLVRRLRGSGAVFLGKTNTAEFGQSATTDNLLGPATRNPWDTRRTPGGSSGGAAASVAARLATVAVGSDGGGSVRIPAAFSGLFGLKTTPGLCPDEGGFRAMTDFVGPGPLAEQVADARALLGVLADREYQRKNLPGRLRVAYCPRPEGRPVDARVLNAVAVAAETLGALGHDVEQVDLDIGGWKEIFGPLVLDDELRERGHLLSQEMRLTTYQKKSLHAATGMPVGLVGRARRELKKYRERTQAILESFDVMLTPTTAVPPFPLDERPVEIDGVAVDRLWGAFPFTSPFNVAGLAAASLPCGLADGLPVGAQLVVNGGQEQVLLDLCEDLEEALGFDRTSVHLRWASESPPTQTAG